MSCCVSEGDREGGSKLKLTFFPGTSTNQPTVTHLNTKMLRPLALCQ
uniref:Uncharacterized protein n=1 Tax=Rhizophora mucronata TaxID=61149 RepID=A0A2P2MQW2_RHIMU